MKSLKTLLSQRRKILKAFLKKEILQVLRDPRMRIVIFVAPIIQLTLFGFALSNETRNVKLAAVYKPHDVGMDDIYKRALASGWFIPAHVTEGSPFEWVRSHEADVVMVAPPSGLGRAVGRNQGRIQLLINGQNSIRAQAVETYLKAITAEVFLEANPKFPVKFEIRALFNPMFTTALYMVPGVMSMLVCLLTILLTSMAVAREREVGTLETLLSAPIDSTDLLLGKTIPFITMGLVQIPLVLAAAVLIFGVPIRGPILMLVVASVFMVMTTVSIGILISTIAKNQQQAMLGGFLFLFPSILLSGLMFPVETMPIYIKALAYMNPLTHFIGLLRNILLVGGDWRYFGIHTGSLAMIALVVGSISFKRFKTTL